MSAEHLDRLFAHMPEDTLVTWYVSLNHFEWPPDCPLACPDAWQHATSDADRMRAGYSLWEYLKAHTSARARSRAWWLVGLHKTEAEWEAYWAREGASPLQPS